MAEWSFWMLEYARVEDHPTRKSLYGVGFDERGYMPYCYVLMEGEGHRVLIDTGFDPSAEFVSRFLPESVVNGAASASSVLAKVGLTPEDIDTILITHAHFDHMGNLQAFPNAQVWIQEREVQQWEYALSLPERFGTLSQATDPADLSYLKQLQKEGRLNLVDGRVEDVLPGVDLVPAFDSHTDGSQYITIHTGGETWVMPGDNVYSYRNVETGSSNPFYRGIGVGNGSLWRSLFVIDEMMQCAGESSRLMIPHEGQLFERFPSIRGEDNLAVAEMRLAPDTRSRLDTAQFRSGDGSVGAAGLGSADVRNK
ncbi:N-acyl homoserine lactonase family protein [Micrococcaceae bacterium Sec5.1]